MLSSSIELNNNSFNPVNSKSNQNNSNQDKTTSNNQSDKVTISEEAQKLADRSVKIQEDAKDIFDNWVETDFILAVPNANPRFSEHNQALLERLEVQRKILEDKVNGQGGSSGNPEKATELQNQLASLKGKIFMIKSYGEKSDFTEQSLADKLDSWNLAFTKLDDYLTNNESNAAQELKDNYQRQVQELPAQETHQAIKAENTAPDKDIEYNNHTYQNPRNLTDFTVSKMLNQYLG